MAEFLEVIMIVSFGASWPLNVIKSYKAMNNIRNVADEIILNEMIYI